MPKYDHCACMFVGGDLREECDYHVEQSRLLDSAQDIAFKRGEQITALESKLDSASKLVTYQATQIRELQGRLQAAEEGWNKCDDAWGKEVAELESRLQLTALVELCEAYEKRAVEIPGWCPQCKAVMAHVPHQCDAVERPGT